jgi:hypothetical protein
MLPMNMDSTLRFSDRVAEYVKYRPSYPAGVITVLQTVLQQECGLNHTSVVADIGSGTGIQNSEAKRLSGVDLERTPL